MIRQWIAKVLGVLPALPVETAGIARSFSDAYGGGIGPYVTYGPESMMQVSALSACVRLISGNVAKLPFHVFRMKGDERERQRNHVVDKLLNQSPNAWQTAHEFRRQLTAHVCLYGNGYAVKLMSGFTIDELIPIHPTNVKIVRPNEDTSVPPVYDVQIKPGLTQRYAASEILHLRDLTLDGVYGLSRIQQARQGALLAHAAETYATAYFMNGAEPGVILETDKTLTEDQQRRLREGYMEAHQGPSKVNLPVVAEGGLKVKTVTQSNKDSQFLELRSFQVEDIARLYGVPPHMIGLTEKQTSYGTGVEQMAIGFLQFNLLDWLVMWESAVKRDLLSRTYDSQVYAEHLVDHLLRADLKTRMDAYAIGIQNGILSRNDARRKENLPAYDGGDDFLYPSNMTINGDPVEAPAPAPRMPADAAKHRWIARMRAAERAVGGRNGNN